MAWKIEFSRSGLRTLEKLDRPVQRRVVAFLEDRIAPMANPRELGEALAGSLKEFWKFRVGDYRLICDVQDERVVILVVEIGHRREVYRRR